MNKQFLTLILVFILTSTFYQSKAQWDIGGNDLTSDGTLGSSVAGDPWDLVFITQGLTRMKINSTGKVGVGDFSLTDPSYAFDIRNTITGRSLYLTNDYNTSSTKYGIYNTVGNIGTGGRYGIYNSTTSDVTSSSVNYGVYSTVTNGGSGNTYGLYSYVSSSGTGTHYGLYSSASGSSNYAVYGVGRGYFSDKVGFGITSPTGQVHIKDVEVDLTSGGSLILGLTTGMNMAFDANEIHARNNGVASHLYLNPLGGSVSINNAGTVTDASLTSEGAFRIGDISSTNMIFDNNEIQGRSNGSANSLGLNVSGGNVYIGTWSGTEKLNVCGGIKATEIRVESGWCDYVFANEYNLPSLDEVAGFIKVNKHLPNIPPAAEVENGGLALGDMSKRMMEKIEELTLYLIQLNTRMNQLETENLELRSSLTSNK